MTAQTTLAIGRMADSRLAAVFCAALLSVFLIYGVGFAHPDILHNAAHDARHVIAFPCH